MKSIAANKRVTRENFLKFNIWVILGIFVVLFLGYAIAYENWFYLGALLVPLLLYLSIEKPFIFPFGLYVFLLPFDSILSVADSTTFTKFIGALTIPVLLLKSLHEKKLRLPNKASIYWVFLMIYAMLSIFWAINPDNVLSRYATVTGLLILYLIVSSYKIHESEFNTCKWCILLGGLMAAILAIYNYETGVFDKAGRATMAYGERSGDPNYFAFCLLLPVSICIEKILNQKKKVLKFMFSAVLSTIILGIIVTGSRGGMLGVCVIFITYILCMKQRITLLAILIIMGIIITSFFSIIFIERWGQAIETGGSGRVDIWIAGFSSLKNFCVVGAGLGNFPNVFADFGHFTPFTRVVFKDPHNIYLEIFVELGIVGFSLLILAMRRHYQVIKSRFDYHDSNQAMLKAAFWALLTSSFFVGTLFLKSFWLFWMMILMYGNIMDKEVYKHNRGSE